MQLVYIAVVILFVTWFIGILTVADTRRKHNYKYHKGGFLDLGFTTHDERPITTRDMWVGVMWPYTAALFFVKGIIYILNELLHLLLLLISFNYSNTRMYKYISSAAQK